MSVEDLSPEDLEDLIVSIIRKKRRDMNPQQITREFQKLGVKISRPTVAKYLKKLKEQERV